MGSHTDETKTRNRQETLDDDTNDVASLADVPGDLRSASRLPQKRHIVPESSFSYHSMNAESRRKLKEEFTMDKLRFNKVGLVGRDAEIQKLQEAFWETLKQTEPSSSILTSTCTSEQHTPKALHPRSVVLIEGAAGTGKSSLARVALQSLVEREEGGFLIQGKHKLQLKRGCDDKSQQQQLKPYGGISDCCEDLCAQMLEKFSQEEMRNVRTTFQTKLGKAEVSVLTYVLPCLRKLLDYFDSDCNTSGADIETVSIGNVTDHTVDVEYTELKQRFSYAFGRFLRILCDDVAPTVLLLDDLQWCDESSFTLLQNILHDKCGARLMIVGTFRGEEVKNDHLLRRFQEKIKSLIEQQNQIQLCHICLGSLSLSATVDLLVELLSIENSKTAFPLARCVHTKTRGNAFFMVQFITSLNQQGLLQFNYGLLKWTWDVAKIEEETTATDNVVELVRLKLSTLAPHLSHIVLPLMASLGSIFHVDLFQMVLHHIQTSSCRSDSSGIGYSEEWKQESSFSAGLMGNKDNCTATDILQTCVKEGLIEPFYHTKNTAYRWIHDKVEEAALTMVPQEHIEDMQLDLGTSLLEQMTEEQIKENIFVLVYLFRTGSRELAPDDPKRMSIAKLKLESGQQAFRASAFDQAACELRMGIELLCDNAWDTSYQVCLELYSTAAEAYLRIGKLDVVDDLVAEIVTRTSTKPLIDRRKAYNVQVRRHMAAGQMNKAVAFLFIALSELGVKIGNLGVKLRLVSKVSSAQKNAKANTQALARLMPVKNDLIGWSMFLLDCLVTCLYQMKDSRFPLAVFKSMELTMKYGTNQVTPTIVVTVGLLCAVVLKDYQAGSLYAIQALDLIEKINVKFSEAKTCFVAYHMVLHQTKPIEETKKGLLKGYHSGMSNGDTEFGLWCMLGYVLQTFLTGAVLELLIHDCKAFIREAEELQRPTHAYTIRCVWQVALNL